MRDHAENYGRMDAVVLGCSPDPPEKLRRFAAKHSLDHPLLSDQDHTIAQRYGVWIERSMYGKRYFGNERTTFVIDPEGVVRHVFRKVKVSEHDRRVLSALGDPAYA